MNSTTDAPKQALATVKVEAQIIERLERGLPPEPTADIVEFARQVQVMGRYVNLLCASNAVPVVPALRRLAWGVTQIDTRMDGNNGVQVYHSDTYHGKRTQDPAKIKVSLTKIALLNLLNTAGGEMTETHRTDDRRNPLCRSWKVKISIDGIDGKRGYWGSRELDLSPGSEQIEHLSPKQLSGRRARISELCETYALERAIRQALAIQGSYTLGELKKPFFVFKVVPHLDMNDADQKALALELHKHAVLGLYGAVAPQPAPAQIDVQAPTPAPMPELPPAPPLPELPPAPEPPPAPPKEPEKPSTHLLEDIGQLAGEIAKANDRGLSSVLAEASLLPSKRFAKDIDDIELVKSTKWQRFTLKRLQGMAPLEVPEMDVDDEVPE